jgi:hypothetical protein
MAPLRTRSMLVRPAKRHFMYFHKSHRDTPDTYVQRGLTYEGLEQWAVAVEDYDKAIQL